MIKAAGSYDGTPMLVLGLSGENVARLAAGEPILVDASEVGLPPIKVLLLYGKTELDIVTQLRPFQGGPSGD